jgi:hypothetical protein
MLQQFVLAWCFLQITTKKIVGQVQISCASAVVRSTTA